MIGRSMRILGLIALWLGVWTSPLTAEEALGSISDRFLSRVWDSSQGLPDVAARSITQTADGHIWVGTFNGLCRLGSGTGFKVFTTQNTPALPTNLFIQLFADQQGRFWAGTDRQLLLRDSNQQWKTFGPEEGWPGDYPHSITQDPISGELILTKGNRVYRYRGNRFELFSTYNSSSFQSGNIRCLYDSNGQLWARTDTDLLSWTNNQWRVLRTASEWRYRFTGFTIAKDGGLWVADRRAIYSLKDGQWQHRFDIPERHQGGQAEMLEDSQGNVWFGQYYHGLAVFHPNYPTLSGTAQNDLTDSNIRCILEERDGNILVGTEWGGMMQFTPRRVQVHHANHAETADNRIMALQKEADQRLLFVTKSAKIFTMQEGVIGPVQTAELPKDAHHPVTILRTKDGNIWLGTEKNGLFRFNGDVWEFLPEAWIGKAEINSLFEDSSGVLWIGQSSGFARYENGQFQVFPLTPLKSRVSQFMESADGQIYLAADTVYRWKKNQLEPLPSLGILESHRVTGLAQTKSGLLFATTTDMNRQLLCFDGKSWTLISDRLGIGKTQLTCVQEDVEGNLWLNSWRGVLYLRSSDIQKCLQDPNYICRPSLIDRQDGMLATHGPTSVQPICAITKDGSYWAATLRGIVQVDLKRLRKLDRPLMVYLEKMNLDDQDIDLENTIRQSVSIPPGNARLQLLFSVPTLDPIDRIKVEYCLDQENGVWTDLGSERQVSLFELSPGKHRLQIRAYSPDSRMDEVGTVLELNIGAYYWQTNWFKYLMAVTTLLGVIVLIGLGWRFKLSRQLERLKQQENLARERARSASLLASTNELVCFTEYEGKVVYLNAAGLKLLKLQEIPDTFERADLFDEAGRQILERAAWPIALDSGSWTGDISLRNSSGESVEVKMFMTLHRLADQRVDFVSIMAEDLSDKQAAAREKDQLEMMLRQSQKMEAIGTLAGGIAHDFNNILTAILGNAELLKMEELSGNAKESVDQVLKASQRAAELVRQILTFSRRTDEKKSPILLEPIVQESLALLRASVPTTITMEAKIESCSPVVANATQIQQILMNLCTNSFHAMPRGGRLLVQLKIEVLTTENVRNLPGLKPGPHVRLTVQDTGEGMDEMTKLRIFDPFFTTKAVGQGTGLGLAVVHGIVQDHQGAIHVQSQPGRGTTFDVYFPIAQGSGMDTSKKPLPILQTGDGEEVMLIDDDPEVLRLADRLLRRLGYRPNSFSSPVQACREFEKTPDRFAVILTDLTMPQLTGLDVARRVRQLNPKIPIILATGQGVTLEKDPTRDHLFFEILDKPYQSVQLSQALAAAIRTSLEQILA